MFYVYTHSTDDGIVFNVGKGSRRCAWNLKHRGSKHRRVAARYGCIVEIVWRTDDEQAALAHEIQLISHFGTYTTEYGDGDIFCNFTLGGEGTSSRSGYVHTPEARAKMSAAVRNPSAPSTQARAKMSAAHMGKRQTPEAIAKVSAALTGRSPSAETRAKMSAAAKTTVLDTSPLFP